MFNKLTLIGFSLIFSFKAQSKVEGAVCANLFYKDSFGSSHSQFGHKTRSVFKKLRENGSPTLVVVDGLSSGALYSKIAKELFSEINVIHIQSSRVMAPGLRGSFEADSYDLNVVYDSEKHADLATLLGGLKANGLQVVPGTETSQFVWSKLSNTLGLPASDFTKVEALNNKYLAAEVLKHSLRVIPGQKFNTFNSALAWTQSNEMKFPLVIKPIDAAGSFGVSVVNNETEFETKFRGLIDTHTPLGRKTKEILVQKYIPRERYTEFVVDVLVDQHVGIVTSDILSTRKKKSTVRLLT